MAKVDVIIPAYNAGRYLSIAIESVLAQTFDDWRILVIDDGSSDNTAEIGVSWEKRLGPRLAYLRKENGGVSSARNLGIQRATADYVAMLDADDMWLPCRLAESVKVLDERPEVGMTYGFIERIDSEGRFIDTFEIVQKNGEGWIAPHIYTKMVDIPCVTVTARRRALLELGGFDENLKVTEDRDLWFRMAQRSQVALVPMIVAKYRVSGDSITSVPDRMLKAQLQFVEKNYGAKGCGWRARRVALGRIYKQRADAFSAQGRSWAAVKASTHAMLLNPFHQSNVRTALSLLRRWAFAR